MPARLPPTSPAAGSQAATALVGPEGLDPKTGEAGGGAGSVSEPSAPPPSRGSRGPGPRSLGRLCSPCTAGGEAWLGLGGACVRVRQCHSHPDPFVFISCRWVPDRRSQPVAGMNSSAREAEAPVRLRIPRGGGAGTRAICIRPTPCRPQPPAASPAGAAGLGVAGELRGCPQAWHCGIRHSRWLCPQRAGAAQGRGPVLRA